MLFYFFICICTFSKGKDLRRFYFFICISTCSKGKDLRRFYFFICISTCSKGKDLRRFYFFICICTCSKGKDLRRFYFFICICTCSKGKDLRRFYFFICICTCSKGKDLRRFYCSLQLLIQLFCKTWQLQQLELPNERLNIMKIKFAVWLPFAYPDNKEDIGTVRMSPLNPQTSNLKIRDFRIFIDTFFIKIACLTSYRQSADRFI